MNKRQQILEAIKEFSPDGISVKDLKDISGSASDNATSNSVAVLRKSDPNIKVKYATRGGSRVSLFYYEKEKKEDSFVGPKNHEQYPDPTAEKALNNLAREMMEKGVADYKREVLSVNIGYFVRLENGFRNGNHEFLIVNKSGRYIYCVPVIDRIPYNSINECVTIEGNKRVLCSYIETIDFSYVSLENCKIGDTVRISSDILDAVKRKMPKFVVTTLVTPADNKVEKSPVPEAEDIKIVAPPTEMVKEESELLHKVELEKQRADIYEKAFYALLGQHQHFGCSS